MARFASIDTPRFTQYGVSMITDADTKKLLTAFKKVFATKDDLVAMEKRQDAKYATKDDLKGLLTKDDAKSLFQTKDEARVQHDAVIIKLNALEKHIEAVDKGLETLNESLIPILGNIHEWTDEIHNEVVRERLLKRVKRLEKHLGLPSLAD